MDDLIALMPFAQRLGVELVAASADQVVCRLAWSPELCTAGGLLHGGVIMTLPAEDGLDEQAGWLVVPATGVSLTDADVRELRDADQR